MRTKFFVLLVALFIAVIALLQGCMQLTGYTYVRNVEATIVDTERIVSEDGSFYLVFTSEGEYKNVDDMLRGKFRSSSVQNIVMQNMDNTVCLKINGRRIGWLSMYPNILEISEGECSD